jgi:CO/xanthine dehydrogenase Mo-binding subunit
MYCTYEAGVDAKGMIQGIKLYWYFNGGAFMDGAFGTTPVLADGTAAPSDVVLSLSLLVLLPLPAGDLQMLMVWADNVYYFPTYYAQGTVCRTNLSATTSMRAPGVPQSIFTVETIMTQIAEQLGMDPLAFRQMNFLAVGDTTPYNQVWYRARRR